MDRFFSVLAGICFLLAFVPYIRAILKGKTKPQKASWIIWLTVDLLVAVAMVKQGVMNGQMAGAILGAGSVVILAFKYGEAGWRSLDKACLSLAVVGIVLWNVLDSAFLGMMISLGIIFIGAFPTFKRAWKAPETESKLAWTLFWVSCVFALLAVPTWTVEHAAQPVVFFVIETVMMWLLFVRGRHIVPSFSRDVLGDGS